MPRARPCAYLAVVIHTPVLNPQIGSRSPARTPDPPPPLPPPPGFAFADRAAEEEEEVGGGKEVRGSAVKGRGWKGLTGMDGKGLMFV